MDTSEEYLKIRETELAEQLRLVQELKKENANITLPEANELLLKQKMKDIFQKIMFLQEKYFDEPYNNSLIDALWIFGTYLYKQFNTFPRIFYNATRGSGKSRKLNFIQALAYNAKLQTNLTEAVLFRTAQDSTILIDEAEGINNKEKSALRELLNAGYKRGNKVLRMKKQSTREGEKQVVESFELYSPLALANINGLEDVLADRAIIQTLEKSNDPRKVNLLEDFDVNPIFKDLKSAFNDILVYVVSVCRIKKSITMRWNEYTQHTLYTLYTYNTLYTLPTSDTPNTQTTQTTLTPEQTLNIPLSKEFQKEVAFTTEPLEEWEIKLFDKIRDADINARHLELFFPLIYIANVIDESLVDKVILAAKEKIKDKKSDERIENRDISLLEYVAKMDFGLDFVPIHDLLIGFRSFYECDDEKLINSEWIGRALKRLQIILDKRRLSKGYEVMLNSTKAKEKIKMFKTEEELKK